MSYSHKSAHLACFPSVGVWERVGARGTSFDDKLLPPASPAADKHPQPLHLPVQPLEQCPSKIFGSDSHSSSSFCLCFLLPSTFNNIQRCFVDCSAKFYSNAMFFMERWSFSLQYPIFLVFFGFSATYFS